MGELGVPEGGESLLSQEQVAGTVVLAPHSGMVALWVNGEPRAARLVYLDGTTRTEALDSNAIGTATSKHPTTFDTCFDKVLLCPVCGHSADGAPVSRCSSCSGKFPAPVPELHLDLKRVRYCGSPYPFGTGAMGAAGQGLNRDALARCSVSRFRRPS